MITYCITKLNHSRFVVFVLLILTCYQSTAQINITRGFTSALYFKYSDALNLNIINGSQNAISGFLIGSVQSNKNGLAIDFKTIPFQLKPGSNAVNATILQAKFNLNDITMKLNLNASSFLPAGVYRIKLSIIDETSGEELADYDDEHEVILISPPFLISPADESVIETANPLLIWSPPLPLDPRGPQVYYDLKLTEVLSGQNPIDAIQRNFPLFKQDGLTQVNVLYPANALPLQKGKHYAWQIQARTKDYFIGNTEVFVFSLPTTDKPNSPIVYGELKSKLDAGIYQAIDKRVYFNYREQYIANSVNFKIIDSKGNDLRSHCDCEIRKQPGENQFLLDLNKCDGLNKGIYILEVYNDKNELEKLKFSIN